MFEIFLDIRDEVKELRTNRLVPKALLWLVPTGEEEGSTETIFKIAARRIKPKEGS